MTSITAAGVIIPRAIIIGNSRFNIEAVTAVAPAPQAGTNGRRYTVIVCGRARYLYLFWSASAIRWYINV